MLNLLKIISNTGDTTVKYPFGPQEVCTDFRGKPKYNTQQCIACGACTVACPANALTMETNEKNSTRTWQLFLGRCIFCGRCEEVCPTRAITLTPEFELAVTHKPDLYTRATFTLLECAECRQPFIADKELEYAMMLLVQSGVDDNTIQEMRPLFETCPACKQRKSLSNNSCNQRYQVVRSK